MEIGPINNNASYYSNDPSLQPNACYMIYLQTCLLVAAAWAHAHDQEFEGIDGHKKKKMGINTKHPDDLIIEQIGNNFTKAFMSQAGIAGVSSAAGASGDGSGVGDGSGSGSVGVGGGAGGGGGGM